MTVSTSASTTTVAGNGVTTQFQFAFIGVSASDLGVVFTDVTGVQTTLLTSQYSVSLNLPAVGAIWGVGGTVTYPLAGPPIAAGTSLTITRTVPLTQTTTISDQGDFAPEVIEQALDTLCFEIQQVAGRTGQFRGTWIPNTAYNYADIVQDGVNGNSTGNYYLCAIANTSSVWSTDLAAGDWILVISAVFPTVTLPLSVANGGTGSSTASGARTNLAVPGLTTANTYTALNDFTGGSAAVPTSATGTNTTTAASTSFAQNTAVSFGSGFVNKFRNPGCVIAQRGLSGTVTAGSTVYTLDGHRLACTGANVTWTQAAQIGHAHNCLQITGATSVTDVKWSQRIESYVSAPFAGQRVTFQATINNSNLTVPVIPTLTVNYATAQDNFGSVTNIISAVTLQSVANASTGIVSYTFDIANLGGASGAANGLEFILDFGTVLGGTGRIMSLSDFDVRITPNATTNSQNANPPFPEDRAIAIERTYCERYLLSFGDSNGLIGTGAATSTTAFGLFIPFTTRMRIAPTGITVTTVGNFQIFTFAASGISGLSTLVFSLGATNGLFVQGSVTSGLTSGVSYFVQSAVALAGNLLITGAEL